MNRNVLVAPLNWGLGHATRCIPIIEALEKHHFTPIIASDGTALEMLRKEFPHLKTLELPSYQIEYAKNGAFFKWKLVLNLPKMMAAIREEKKLVKNWIEELELVGIISDNRLGVSNRKVPSVFMTHQLNVLSGMTTWISSKLHQQIIRKYDECWVPDWEAQLNLTGNLGHLKKPKFNVRYIGPLSRFKKKELPKKYDLMVILSGPEPQRGILEHKLRTMLPAYAGQIVFICGKIEAQQKSEQRGNITFYNFMQTEQLQQTFNESETVLCRSGYTTVMDLVQLGNKAFFIPTPGQYEQEYLAKKLKGDGFVPYVKQDDFKLENLLQVDVYKGLPQQKTKIDWVELFGLFERK